MSSIAITIAGSYKRLAVRLAVGLPMCRFGYLIFTCVPDLLWLHLCGFFINQYMDMQIWSCMHIKNNKTALVLQIHITLIIAKKKTYCSETYNFQRSYHIITSSNNVHLNNHRYFSGNNTHLNDQIANNFQATLHA